MDGGDDRRVDQPRKGQRARSRPGCGSGRTHRRARTAWAMWSSFPDLGVEARVFRIAARGDAIERARGDRIERGEQGHVDAARDQRFGQQAGDELPRPVGARRGAPGDRATAWRRAWSVVSAARIRPSLGRSGMSSPARALDRRPAERRKQQAHRAPAPVAERGTALLAEIERDQQRDRRPAGARRRARRRSRRRPGDIADRQRGFGAAKREQGAGQREHRAPGRLLARRHCASGQSGLSGSHGSPLREAGIGRRDPTASACG